MGDEPMQILPTGAVEQNTSSQNIDTSIYPDATKGYLGGVPSPQEQDTRPQLSSIQDDKPVAVVKVLSVKGVEYAMMTLALWFGASAISWILLAIINSYSGFSVLAFPVSLLLVSLPIFAFLFLRLRKAELANPTLRFDPSKRRLSQITQIFTFITCVFNITFFVYTIMTKIGGKNSTSLLKEFLSLLVILVIAGGILTYYWFDEHRLIRR